MIHPLLRVVSTLPLAFVLGACSSWGNLTYGGNPTPAPAPVVDASPSLDIVIVRMTEISELSGTELRGEFNRVEQGFANWGTVASRFELAWLLSRPSTGFQDNRRAVELLRDYLQQPEADPAYQAFARMLYDLIIERAVQRAASSRAKEALALERRQAETLQEQIATLLHVLATLQSQVEALRDIEKNISGRAAPDDTERLLPDDSAESNTPGG